MKERFSSNIRELRKDFNVSQLQLAKEIGYGKSIISDWETGVCVPSAKAVIILSRYFQVTTDYLLCQSADNSMIHRIDDLNADMYTFMQRLRELRATKNLSQEKLGIATNIPQPTIDRWELGVNVPNAKAIIDLANFFGVTTDYLLGESD